MDNLGASFSRTQAAVARLGAAIDRLEDGAARLQSGDLLLAGELREAREQYEALQETTRVVSHRLDHVIKKISTMVEE